MPFQRTSGILLHPTSLPGPHGIGDLGREAYRFADCLHAWAQGIWQILPIGPPGLGDSPYQSYSSFAANPLLISLESLREWGLLHDEDFHNAPDFPVDRVDFAQLIPWKTGMLRKAYDRFRESGAPSLRTAFEDFRQRNYAWLEDYALFMALSEAHNGAPWPQWEPELVSRDPEALAAAHQTLDRETDRHRFGQFLFSEQWTALKTYCNERGIQIMGDVPIYTAHNSADVWARPDLFHLDAEGHPTLVAGVPPDYFSATGQHWGNPLYRWERMEEEGYRWWIDRIRSVMARHDMLRIDHFRGFESYWEIPAGETTAINGRWVAGPGRKLFTAIFEALGDVPILAENLGVITPEVEALRRDLGLPGMAVLQFAFGTDRNSPGPLPHTYTVDTVAYTGTHDNDTVVGWWNSTGENTSQSLAALQAERRFARKYLDCTGHGIHWDFIRGIMGSIAAVAIVPLQDLLGLGSEARMNVPGTLGGNWSWRVRADMLDPEAGRRLREMTLLYGRAPNHAPVDALWETWHPPQD